MNYSVFDPSPALQPYVKCFWTLEDDGTSQPVRQRVVPDGCMELIIHYGDTYKQYFEDGSAVIQPRGFIFGQITSVLEICPTGKSGIVAARFFPEGLMPFLDLPLVALENRAVGLFEIFGEPGKNLEDRIIDAATNQQRIQLIEDFLLSLLSQPRNVDAIIKACVETIIQSQGRIDVLQLATKMKLSRRNMERKFSAVIGMSPKQLSKVIRLQATLKMLEQKKFTTLTSLAYENGYYDQAHFIKDFREFTGMSPKSFFADNLKLSSLFIAAE